eukprot:g5113.t1
MKATYWKAKVFDDPENHWDRRAKTDELYIVLWHLYQIYDDSWKPREKDISKIPPKTVGVWDEKKRMCFIHVERGKIIHSMGVTRKSRRALYLEETLWLIQQRKLSVVLEERDVKDKKKHLDWRKFNQRYFSDSPYFLEWYSVYNYLRECHYIARRPENGKARIFRFTKNSVTFHDTENDTEASLKEIREASLDVFEGDTAFSRKRTKTPNWVCFVCLFETRSPSPSQFRRLLEACAPIPARIAVVDSIKNILLYRLGKVYELKETQKEEKNENAGTVQ